jgi:hypothetical protein
MASSITGIPELERGIETRGIERILPTIGLLSTLSWGVNW